MSTGHRVVDMHVHYYPEAYVQALLEAATIESYRRGDGRMVYMWRGGVSLTVPEPHPTVAERLEMMEEFGIDVQVLSVPSPSCYFLEAGTADSLARLVNEEFAAIVADHPGRFRALGMVVMQDTERALAGLDHVLDELGMDGVMLLTNVDGVPLDDRRFEQFWEAANDRSLLVYVHPTVPDAEHLDDYALAIAVGFFADTNLAIARLAYAGVFERYPDIRWVFSHLGGTLPFMLPRLDSFHRQFEQCRERCPRPPSEYVRGLTFDTATTHLPAIRCALDTLGSDRLVFGSDYPHVPAGSGPFLDAVATALGAGDQLPDLLSGRADRLLAGAPV